MTTGSLTPVNTEIGVRLLQQLFQRRAHAVAAIGQDLGMHISVSSSYRAIVRMLWETDAGSLFVEKYAPICHALPSATFAKGRELSQSSDL